MAESTEAASARTGRRILAVTLLVLVVEAIGIAAGIPAYLMNVVRFGEVFFAGVLGLGTREGVRRWGIALGVLTGLELVLAVAGAYVGLVWLLRIFLYPLALLFTSRPGDEVRFGWVWAAVLGAMVLCFLLEKGTDSGSTFYAWGARLLLAAGVGGALVCSRRTWKVLTSLKFAAVVLTLLTLLCIIGTLVVQRPPVSPDEYPEKFAAGQVGFVVNGEVLLGLKPVPEKLLWSDAEEAHAQALAKAFGDQTARNYRRDSEARAKNGVVARRMDALIRTHQAQVDRLMHFFDSVYFTSMFKSLAFNCLLVLICLSLLAVIVKKYPWGRYEWGPVVTHAGIVLALIGCAVSDLWLQKGFVEVKPQGAQSRVTGFYDQRGEKEGEFEFGNGTTLDTLLARLRKTIRGQGQIVLYGPAAETALLNTRSGEDRWTLFRGQRAIAGGAAAKATAAGFATGHWRASPWVDLPFTLRMTDGYVEVYRELSVEVTGSGPHDALTEEYPLTPGKRIELFGGRYVVKILDVYDHARIGADGADTVVREMPAQAGTRQKLSSGSGEYEVEVLAAAGDYGQQEQGVAPEKQTQTNPAAHVRVKAPSGEEETVWILERYPDFYRNGAMGKRNRKVGVENIVLAGDDPAHRVLKVTLPSGAAAAPRERDWVVTPVKVARDEIPPADLQPVIRVSLTGPGPDGESTTVTRWLRVTQDTGDVLASADGKVKLRHIDLLRMKSVYETHVDVLSNTGEKIRSAVIRVNEPLVYQGYRFYQSTFSEVGVTPPTSGLTVKYDAGLPLLYAGFLVCLVGIVFAFYVLPPLRRRAEKEKQAEFSADVRKGMGF